jgi:hypothetical protein
MGGEKKDGGKDREGVSMKRNRFFVAAMAAVLSFGLIVTSCGGGNPKALAKQSYEISQQALAALFSPTKAAQLEKKAADIEKKVAKLSEADKAVYNEELARLMGTGLGGLFNAASDALNDVDTKAAADALESAGKLLNAASGLSGDSSVQDAQKAAQNAANALESANRLLDSASGLSDDPSVQDAQKAAQSAADALKSFGF